MELDQLDIDRSTVDDQHQLDIQQLFEHFVQFSDREQVAEICGIVVSDLLHSREVD